MINKNEKILITCLTVGILIMIFLIIYITNKFQDKNYIVKNNKIRFLHVGSEIEPYFKEAYENDKAYIGQYDIKVFKPLIQSSDIVPGEWNKITKEIIEYYNDYDVFIILHDKDTLVYTASAVSFMIENLDKPIIFTHKNLYETMLMASQIKIPEVMIYSSGKLIRASRATPLINEFISTTYPQLNYENCLKIQPNTNVSIKYIDSDIKIILVKMFPGIDAKYLNNLLNDGVNGIIFEMYGEGHSPTNKEFLKSISELANKNIVMVAISQALGKDKYLNKGLDIRLVEAGVLDGYCMTAAAAFTKLYYLMSNVKDRKLIGKLIEQNFRGEM